MRGRRCCMFKIIDDNDGRELATAMTAKSASEAAGKALHEGFDPVVIDAAGRRLSEEELAKLIAQES